MSHMKYNATNTVMKTLKEDIVTILGNEMMEQSFICMKVKGYIATIKYMKKHVNT